jgi:hypothetical protein
MRSAVGFTLGVTALVQVTVAAPVMVAQAADPHACTYFQASDLLQITGRKDLLGQGPRASKPGETLAGTTECDFLNVSMTVTSNMTPAWFARDKASLEKTPDRWKVESVSGLGEEAYYMWDPRPGSDRNVGIVYRAGGKRVSVGDMVASDQMASTKSMLMEIAKLALPKLP